MRKSRDLGQPGDIAFLLIIFFILLAGVSVSRSLPLTILPDNSENVRETEQLTITLLIDGSLSAFNKSITEEQLHQLISSSTDIRLFVEKDTVWQYVVDTLSLIERSSPASLSLEVAP